MTTLKGTVKEMATAIALEKDHRVLVLTGKLDGRNGLPKRLEQHGEGVKLRALAAYTPSTPTGIFEVLDEDALCAVIDELQSAGGYRAFVVDGQGRRDPSYAL